jgi:hypothetical protein
MIVTFSRPDPVGYHRITVRYEPDGPVPRSDPVLPLLLQPIELSLDSVTPPMFEQPGEEEAYWAASEAAVEAMAAITGGGPRDVPAMRATVRRVRALGHPDQIITLTRYIYPLVRFFGDELNVGASEGGYGTVETAIGAVSYTNEWVLERVGDGVAHIRYRRFVEPEEQARVRDAFRAARGRAPNADEMRLILPHERVGTYRLSLESGLPVYFDETELAWERVDGVVRQHARTHRLELQGGTR